MAGVPVGVYLTNKTENKTAVLPNLVPVKRCPDYHRPDNTTTPSDIALLIGVNSIIYASASVDAERCRLPSLYLYLSRIFYGMTAARDGCSGSKENWQIQG
jgi:hypothetical protein